MVVELRLMSRMFMLMGSVLAGVVMIMHMYELAVAMFMRMFMKVFMGMNVGVLRREYG